MSKINLKTHHKSFPVFSASMLLGFEQLLDIVELHCDKFLAMKFILLATSDGVSCPVNHFFCCFHVSVWFNFNHKL